MSDDRMREADMSRPDKGSNSNALDKSKPSSPLHPTIDSSSLPASDETIKHAFHSTLPKSGPFAAPHTTAVSGTDQTIQLDQSAQTRPTLETKDTAHHGASQKASADDSKNADPYAATLPPDDNNDNDNNVTMDFTAASPRGSIPNSSSDPNATFAYLPTNPDQTIDFSADKNSPANLGEVTSVGIS